MLALRDVDFAYGERPILRAIDLAVEVGELVGLVGPSGSGKSTILRLAAGLLAPARGRVEALGVDPARAPRAEVARRLAYVAQEVAVDFPFSVAEIVLMGRYPHRRGPGLESAQDVRLAEAAMARADVSHLAARRFTELSGGERRRALLAQAFCQGASLLLLDEPTAALDPAHAIALLETVRAERSSALLATHDLHLAARFCDRVALVDAGRIVAMGTPEILAAPEASRVFAVELHAGRVGDVPYVVPGRRL